MTSIQISGLREDLETIELLSAEIFQENEVSAKTKICEFRADSIEVDQILPVLTVTFSGVSAVVGIINLVLSIQGKKNKTATQKKTTISIKIEASNNKELNLEISGSMTDTQIKKCLGAVQDFVDGFLLADDGISLRVSESEKYINQINMQKVNLLFSKLLIQLTDIRKVRSLPPIKNGEQTIFKFTFDKIYLTEIINYSEKEIFYLHLDEAENCQDIFHVLERENILFFHKTTNIRTIDRQNIFVGYEIEKLPIFKEVSCSKEFIFSESKKENYITNPEKIQREMAISNDSIQKLLPLLRPYLRDENERRAYLITALGMNTPALNRLVLNTPVNVFIPSMVKELVNFGNIAPGQPALCALLEVIREDVGVDIQGRIDELLRQIKEELTETSVNHERVQSGREAQTFDKSLQTTDALIKQVEQYLSEWAYIPLEKLVIREAKALAEVMQGELPACPWMLSMHNQQQCQQCLEHLEAKSERFVRILATIVYHDQNAQFITPIAKAFGTLARQPVPINTNFTDESRFVRLYPLALAIYAVFIVGVQEEREQLLRTVLGVSWHRQADSLPTVPLIYILSYLDGYYRSIFNAILGGTGSFAPVAERIKIILLPWLEELLLDANAAFYQGEFVLGLANIEAPPYLSNEKCLSLQGLYLYYPQARPILTAFLRDSSQWLISLYPSMEELLGIFDATASKLDREGFGRMYGFCRGGLPAFRGEVWD